MNGYSLLYFMMLRAGRRPHHGGVDRNRAMLDLVALSLILQPMQQSEILKSAS